MDRRAFLDAEDHIVATPAGTLDLKGIGQHIEAIALRALKP
jgi:hypothetical protein